MGLGLFSLCSNVEKLPPSPFLGHTGDERLLRTVPKHLTPGQEGPSGAKTLIAAGGGKAPVPSRTEPRRGVQGGPIPSVHPSIPVSSSHSEVLGLSPSQWSGCVPLW